MTDESQRLLSKLGDTALVILDERGKSLTSDAFAAFLRRRRDSGSNALAFVIGGPDGHGTPIRERASDTLSFGAMTMPHGLARVLLAEQLYRAATIISGHPYHRA